MLLAPLLIGTDAVLRDVVAQQLSWLGSRVLGPAVLELGALDGLLTEQLVARGLRVVAVEGDAQARQALRQRVAELPFAHRRLVRLVASPPAVINGGVSSVVVHHAIERAARPGQLVEDLLSQQPCAQVLIAMSLGTDLAGREWAGAERLADLCRPLPLEPVEDTMLFAGPRTCVWLSAWRVCEDSSLSFVQRLCQRSITAATSWGEALRQQQDLLNRLQTREEAGRRRLAASERRADGLAARAPVTVAVPEPPPSPSGDVAASAPRTDTATRSRRLLRRARQGPPTGSRASRPGDATLPLRVGFVGDAGLAVLAAGVRAVAVDPQLAAELGELVGGVLDVLVVDRCPAGWSTTAVESLVAQARALGARIVEHADAGAGRRAWEGAVDLTVGPRFVPGVDLREINPIGFRRSGGEGWAAVGISRDDHVAQLSRALPGEPTVDVVDADGADLVALVRGRIGVVDHAGLHPDTVTRAQRLVSLAAAGVPVAVLDDADDTLRAMVGTRLSAAMTAVDLHALAKDPEVRERHSVTLRRIAMDEHTVTSRWRELAGQLGIPLRRPPTVSVLLATNRPDFLDHAVQQVNRQRYQPRELVVALHGDAFPADTATRLASLVHGELTVVSCPDHYTLGDVLNTAADAAAGDILSKMDDDDWYGPDHLSDLVHALDYSGAHLVGKGAEFVHLAELDLTIRRFTDRAETPSRTIGGGTFLMRRSDLRSAGSWPRVRSGVDQTLIDAFLREGMTVHRTHGYGYLLARRASGHTWAPSVDYFLRQSVAQWRGVARAEAGL